MSSTGVELRCLVCKAPQQMAADAEDRPCHAGPRVARLSPSPTIGVNTELDLRSLAAAVGWWARKQTSLRQDRSVRSNRLASVIARRRRIGVGTR